MTSEIVLKIIPGFIIVLIFYLVMILRFKSNTECDKIIYYMYSYYFTLLY